MPRQLCLSCYQFRLHYVQQGVALLRFLSFVDLMDSINRVLIFFGVSLALIAFERMIQDDLIKPWATYKMFRASAVRRTGPQSFI